VAFCTWFVSLPALQYVCLDNLGHTVCVGGSCSGGRGAASTTWLRVPSPLGPFWAGSCGWPGFLKLFPSPVPWACSWPRKHQVAEIISQDCTIYVGGMAQFTQTGSLQNQLMLAFSEVNSCSKLEMLKESPA